MKKFKVIFEVYMPAGNHINETVMVEAGNMKTACVRAMAEMSKLTIYEGKYKKIKSVEAVP